MSTGIPLANPQQKIMVKQKDNKLIISNLISSEEIRKHTPCDTKMAVNSIRFLEYKKTGFYIIICKLNKALKRLFDPGIATKPLSKIYSLIMIKQLGCTLETPQ
ncbi:hypothetical protein [Borrelia sp. RT5S]|uniref:hypothetical protein n=1 Tax=Borrelia sp. RT5S TaxID=2898581 RepID=UPI001E65CB89|nr:hypothetical protein [Borrelia sp. RT5S]UGQ16622.1 hypothetical protein LSO06_04745 [Borrelia sp. RT5S]